MEEPQKLSLDEWIKRKKISSSALARMLGCTEATVSGWRTGKKKPHRFHKELLLKISNGEIDI
jgi:DNA-binding transcriptional regulator YiaG